MGERGMWENISKRIKQGLKSLFRFLIDEKTLPHCLVLFVVLIVGFGIAYAFLTPSKNGVEGAGVADGEFGLLEGVYFSIVTMSSLGYGDLHPKGWSKVLASTEVLMGLLLIGLMIAKLTSWRLSHFVSRLFVSDVRTRLKEFTSEFTMTAESLKKLLTEFARVYQQTPGERNSEKDNGQTSVGFGVAVTDLLNISTSLRNYFQEGTFLENHFELVPRQDASDLCEAIYESYFMLNQCIISLPISSNPKILDDVLSRRNRASIMESIDMQKQFCQLGMTHGQEESIIRSLRRIQEVCKSVPTSYFMVPSESEPDQMVFESVEPETTEPRML